MSTAIAVNDVATTGSDHIAPGPAPAVSLAPPPPPAGPVPTPFMYVAKSSTATQTSSKLTVAGKPVLVVESAMAIEQPGNLTTNPTGGDIVTHMMNAKAGTFTGAANVFAEGKKVCCTFDNVYLNIPTGASKVAQLTTKLLAGAFLRSIGGFARAFGANFVGLMDPISAASGEVFDDELDLALAGLIPVEWKRLYSSSRSGERSPLGRGGWTHSLHQWIALADDRLALRSGSGRDVSFRALDRGASAYHRGQRLTLTRTGDEAFEVEDLATRVIRTFRALSRGGPAMLHGMRDAWGNAVELTYEDARLTRVVSPSRRELRLTHDDRGRIARVEAFAGAGGAAQQAVTYAYTPHGELESATDALGNTARYAYDGHHRLVAKTLQNGLAFRYAYDDATDRCIKTWADGGLHAADLQYDLDKGTTALTGTPRARVYAWDARGAVVSEASSDGAIARTMTYDDDLLLTRLENGLGEALVVEHDERGLVTKVVDAEGRATVLEYDGGLRVKQIDPGGFESAYRYDDRGALIAVRYPSGLGYDLHYDGRGRVASVVGPDGTCAAFEYDEHDNAVVEIGPLGERTSFAFDPLGRIVAITDPQGRTVRIERDALGQMIRRVDPAGGTYEVAYDALGRVVEETDPIGGRTRIEYGGTHSLRRQTMQDGQVWSCDYDTLERLRAVRNPKQEAWEYRYDRAGRVREERTFDGRVLRYRYAKSERPLRVERADGTWRAFVTDATGRVLAETSPHGAIEFERDALGRVVRAVVDEASGKTEVRFAYDRLGRQVAEVQDGAEIRYEYDDRNRLAARILPGGEVTRYGYDGAGGLARLEHAGREIAIERNLAGFEVRRRYRDAGVEIASERDALDRLVRQRVLGRSGALLLERTYGYDARGWVRAIGDSMRGAAWFEHDAVGQLVEVRRSALREVIHYDAAGSVVGVGVDQPSAAPWSLLPGNVLVRTGDAEYEVDDGRRRVKRRDRDGETEYLWDCRDRLREVRLPGGERVLFTYDPYGRRVRKDVVPPPGAPGEAQAPSRTVRYLWEGRVLAADIDTERGTRIYAHEPGTFSPVVQAVRGEVLAFVHDHLRAGKELVDERGEIAWAMTQSAWGEAIEVRSARPPAEAAAVASPFRLLGHYHDEETGLCYARFRYFDPRTARWLSPDPLGLGGSRNPAGFCGSPVVHVDPFGLKCTIGSPAFDLYLQYAQKAPPQPGYYDVNVHGSPDSVAFKDANGKWTALTPKELAAKIMAQPDYVAGGKVRLNSCNVGRLPEGFAQQLAKELNAPVSAPNRTVWASSNGNLWVGDKANSTDPVTGVVSPVDAPGQYVEFNPPPAVGGGPTPILVPPS